MQSVSDSFKNAMRHSARRLTYIDVHESFSETKIFENVPIIDGSISVDRNSEIRRSGSMKLGQRSLTDVFLQSQGATAFGLEVHVWHGFGYPNGSEEYIRLGVFTLENFSWEEGDGGWPVIQLYDRMQWLKRANLPGPRDYSGRLSHDVINEIVTEAIPGVTIQYQVGIPNPRLPGGTTFDSGRIEVLQKCLEAMGCEGYFDHDGILQIKEIVDPLNIEDPSIAAWTFNVGEYYTDINDISEQIAGSILEELPPGNLVGASRSVTREDTFNAVAVYGAAPDDSSPQPYALAYDDDPNSPTYYEGAFGKSVKRIDNQLLTTTDQCAEAAAAELRNQLGLVRNISFSALSNPALESGDYVLFVFNNGTQEVHLLDSFSIPLVEGEFTGTTRTSPTRQRSSIAIQRRQLPTNQTPTAPTNLKVTQSSSHSSTRQLVTISWKHSTPVFGWAIMKYEVIVGADANGEGGRIAITVGGGQTTAAFLADKGTTISIRVRAVDVRGELSPPSAAVSYKVPKSSSPPSTPPPPSTSVKTYKKVYTATWSGTYTGGNKFASWHGSKAYQGYVSGGNGNYRSLIGFNDAQIRRDLAGATISSCRVYLYFSHWYKNSGGTAVIGTHRYSTRPSSWSNALVSQDRGRSSNWPKPGGRWVNLGTKIGNEFRTGSTRGIALGPGPSNSTTYYGLAKGAGSCKVEIVYRK